MTFGPEKRIHARCGESLEFPELRGYLGRSRNKGFRELLLHQLLHPVLMRWIQIRKQKADRNRFYPFFPQFPNRAHHLKFIERNQHISLRRHQPFGNDFPVLPLNQGF